MNLLYGLLKIDWIRYGVGRVRRAYFVRLRRALRVWNGTTADQAVFENGKTTVAHNLPGLRDVSGARALRTIKPLSVIELLRPLPDMPRRGGELHDLGYPCDARVLTIGPRTEGEILCLIGYGFKPANVRGLDLISYSPFIDVGDMHRMPYADGAFDVVIASCVLVYSTNPRQACAEILRVCRAGGIVCIAQDTSADVGAAHAAALGKPTVLADDYLALFGERVRRVFFRHELPERLGGLRPGEGSDYTLTLIFQLT